MIRLLLVLAACQAPSTPCERAFWLDADGDGYGGREETWVGCEAPPGYVAGEPDCDDADPDEYPGADERCDEVDNDCDGEIDEDPANPPELVADADGDGYGDPSGETRWACPGEGWTLDRSDCDDTLFFVNPGAEETCDELDRDCDGDPYLGATDGEAWYVDDDEDGYGQPVDATTGCGEPPAGWSLVDSDCDDGDEDVWPGAPEGVFDGTDSDCDGLELCPYDGDGDGYAGSDTVFSDLGCSLNGATGQVGDCDDIDPAVSPDATELPYTGVDEDCDPTTRDDDLDEDGFGVDEECDDLDPQSNPANEPPSFVDVAPSLGIDLPQWDTLVAPASCPMSIEWMAGGAAVADYDDDGRMDLFLPRMYAPDLLYRQRADGGFDEVASAAGVDWSGSSNGALWFDAEGDGDLDLVVVMLGAEPNRLYIHDGAGGFTEEGVARGVDLGAPADCAGHWSVSAGDVDGDGDLDLHLTQWQDPSLTGADRSLLLINDGAGFFTDETASRNVDFSLRAGLTSALVDLDFDGDQDLALTADHGTSGLFENDGTGSFSDVTGTAGVGTDENGAGADFGDVDGDGILDWFIASVYDDFTVPCSGSWGCTGNRLFRGLGGLTYTDETTASGLRDGAWGSGAAFVDIDHDGDLDLAQQNGMLDVGFADDVFRMFVNDGTGSFTDESCLRRTEHPGLGRAVVPFDKDGDGDLDLLLTFTAAAPMLLENQGGDSAGAWLRVALSDPGPNPFGIGAIVRAIGGSTQVRVLNANSSFAASGPPEVHFGLGTESSVDLEITWPDGAVQLEPGVAVGQMLTVARTVP